MLALKTLVERRACQRLSILSTIPSSNAIYHFNTNVDNSSATTPISSPSLKDPILSGLKLNLLGGTEHFEVSLEEIEVSKLEIRKTFGFELRDLRAIRLTKDISHNRHKYASPTFFVREHAFLAHLNDITALISSDKCYLFNIMKDDDDSFNIVHKFTAKLQSTLIFNTLPFQFHCLEAVCKAVVSRHRNNLFRIEKICEHIMNDEQSQNTPNQQSISSTKIKLIQATSSAKACVDALHELLNNSEDLQAMYLSEKSTVDMKEDKQLELLLENYLWQFDEVLDRLQLLLEEVTMFERSVGFLINKQRNDIIRMNLKLSVLTCSFGCGALGAGIFGMNLLSQIETHPLAFYGGAVGFGCFIPFMIWRHFKIDLQSKHIDI